MKITRFAILFFVIAVGRLADTSVSAQQTNLTVDSRTGEVLPPDVDEVLRTVKRALRDAQTRLKDDGLPILESVTLTLQTAVTKTGGGSVKLIVVGFGVDWERAGSQQVTLKLVPPEPNIPKEVGADSRLYETLVEAITAAGNAAQKTRAVAAADPVPLKLTNVTCEIALSIKRTAGGNAGLKFEPIDVSGKGGVVTAGVNKITIAFKE